MLIKKRDFPLQGFQIKKKRSSGCVRGGGCYGAIYKNFSIYVFRASLSFRNKFGATPLNVAVASGHNSTVR